ncbi:MAG TPA: response regulator transcription factor [Chloroflexota bacterium]|nr:response regulator transcription factor [Chloroflexota bacterium]
MNGGSTREGQSPSPAARVLVIDDEPHIVDFITLGLQHAGYSVAGADDGLHGLNLVQEWKPDLVILDVMLPGLDGLQVCRRIRARGGVPILLLTARGEVEDRVRGLDMGADDYLCKPFSFSELAARVRALLRRQGVPTGTLLHWADLQVDTSTREVTRGEIPIALTVREYDLLLYLLRHPRQVLTRSQILESVWGYDFAGDDNVVEVYVRYLRTKLGDYPPKLLQTVRGVGYALRGPQRRPAADGQEG